LIDTALNQSGVFKQIKTASNWHVTISAQTYINSQIASTTPSTRVIFFAQHSPVN